VNKHVMSLALASILTTPYAGAALAAEDPARDVVVAKDLTAVIALQGLPCGRVVSSGQQGPDDYVATCEDGKRYRVYVNADGRVIVQKLN
jgi:hypothetical protein